MKDSELLSTLNAKVAAMELVAIALMREQRGNAAFWERIEKITATSLAHLESHAEPLAADRIQGWLDLWRQAAGPDGRTPAQP